jgi:thiamine pyrophosphokinase
MKRTNVQSSEGVTLVGGGFVAPEILSVATALAPVVVGADGGANACKSAGLTPRAVIGDFDSLDDAARQAFPDTAFLHVAEQDTTDFEKSLTRIDAPFILATGFTAPRQDHTLAVLSVLARRVEPLTVVLGEADVIFAAPLELALDLKPGTRVSLFPLAPVTVHATGLKWPLDGLTLDPRGALGTSNEATGDVTLRFDAPGCLVLMPLARLPSVLRALVGPRAVRGQ